MDPYRTASCTHCHQRKPSAVCPRCAKPVCSVCAALGESDPQCPGGRSCPRCHVALESELLSEIRMHRSFFRVVRYQCPSCRYRTDVCETTDDGPKG